MVSIEARMQMVSMEVKWRAELLGFLQATYLPGTIDRVRVDGDERFSYWQETFADDGDLEICLSTGANQ